jgi:hypothetical protein
VNVLRADLKESVPSDVELEIRFVELIPSEGPKLGALVCALPEPGRR